MNVRLGLHADVVARAFADKLLRLGETKALSQPDCISLHSFGTLVENIITFLDTIYPGIAVEYIDHTWLMHGAILAPHTDSVSQLINF